MSSILQNLVFALNDGASYALIALGYTMVYGVLRLINFAHGDIYMLGAYGGAYMARYLNPPTAANQSPQQSWWQATLGIAVSVAICGAIGWVIERLAYRPLRNSPKLSALITAIGVSLLIEYLAQMTWTVGGHSFFGPNPMTYQPIAGSGELWTIPFFALFPFHQVTVHVGDFLLERLGVRVINKDAVVIFTTLAVLAGLYFLVKHTRMGKAMRAVSQDYDAARLMGINLDRVISFTFVLGSMLAAIGGCLHGLNNGQIDPLIGLNWGLKAFVAAVIGGIGSIPGAAVGGLVLGIIETYVSSIQYHHEAILGPYRDAIAFFILILMLLVRPEGLFGKAVPEKV